MVIERFLYQDIQTIFVSNQLRICLIYLFVYMLTKAYMSIDRYNPSFRTFLTIKLIQIRNNKGPSFDPCSTLDVASDILDLIQSMRTCFFQLVKKSLIDVITELSTSTNSLLSRIYVHLSITVSN